MSTENPTISNFNDLEGLARILNGAELSVTDGGPPAKLTAENNLWTCDQETIGLLAITFRPGIEVPELASAAMTADLSGDDLDLVLVAEDPFLKERKVLYACQAADATTPIRLTAFRSKRERVLQNSTSGLLIEAWVVLNKDLPAKPGRPHRRGTKLAGISFRVKAFPDASGLIPIPLTEEVIQAHGLTKRTQMFVRVNESLLHAEGLSEALTIFANPDLLDDLKRRRRGPEYNYVAAGLAIGALQQIAFAVSAELNADSTQNWAEKDSEVLDFISDKLSEVPRSGKKKLTREGVVDLLRDDPHVAASLLSSLGSFPRAAHQLLTPVVDEEE